jgi:hypothetical protein
MAAGFVLRAGAVVNGGRVLGQVGPRHARLHPHIELDAAQQQMVPQGMRQHACGQLPVGQLAQGQAAQVLFALHLGQRGHHLVAIRHHGVRPRKPLFAFER